MKILIIRMFPNVVNINNYNMQEIGLANALIKKGHICDIVYYGNENKIQILENNIKIYWVKGKNFLKNAIYDKSLYEIVKDYDVIQTSEYNQIGNIKLLKECGNKLVIYHGPYASIYNKKFQFKCNLFDKVYFNFYPKYKEVPIIAKSKLAENYLRSKKFKNITTIGVGFNPQRFENIKSNNDKFKEISSDFVNLLYVGEINDNKNIKFLLKTFHKVCCNCKNVKLIIVGKGTDEYKNECFDLAKQLGIFENIIYYESVGQAELPYLYNKCKIFLLPSKHEIFGMVLLEAMFMGLIPITTLHGGSSTLIENEKNGFILDLDEELWSTKILNLINAANDISENAKNTIKNNFIWDRIVERFEEIYSSRIGGNNE